MLRLFVIFVLSAAAAAAIPVAYQRNPDAFHDLLGNASGDNGEVAMRPAEPAVRTLAAAQEPAPLLGRKVRIEADQRGHFVADFKLNGRRVNALVDTGATLVAINLSTARRIGLSIKGSDFIHQVSTANGKAKAALVRIDELQVGKVVVNGVDAVVMEDDALSETLIGMNFLQRLSKFTVEDGALLLVQ